MKIGKNLGTGALLLFMLCAGTVLAAPQNGFGLNAGFANHSRSCGACTGTTTSGLSVGIDYQFAISDTLSISPFLMSSGETSANVSDVGVGHGILGGQLRYWVGDIFFGVHLANYSEAIVVNGGTSASTTAFGSGLVAGWEKPDGGMYVMGQVDSVNLKYSGRSDIPISGFRFSVGYRWK